MTMRESKGAARKKASEPVVPIEETAKKGSKERMKAKTSKVSSPAEVTEKHGTEERARKGNAAEKTARPCTVQNNSTGGLGGIEKEYLTSNSSCRLTFRLPKDAVGPARKVTIVGDFNTWNREASPMKKLRNGDFEATLELPAGKEYRFRYLIDGCRWENDWCADEYKPNPYGSDDSVVIVCPAEK
jgi:hypothetical protein